MLYITFTCSLVHVVLGTYLLQRSFFRKEQFGLVEQFLYLDTWEKLDDLVSDGRCRSKYFAGEIALRVGRGKRWTRTPLVQPSLRQTVHIGVQENLRYSRKYFRFVLLLTFQQSVFFILLNYDVMCPNTGIFLFH